jgi:hypothetical protein
MLLIAQFGRYLPVVASILVGLFQAVSALKRSESQSTPVSHEETPLGQPNLEEQLGGLSVIFQQAHLQLVKLTKWNMMVMMMMIMTTLSTVTIQLVRW